MERETNRAMLTWPRLIADWCDSHTKVRMRGEANARLPTKACLKESTEG